MREMTLKCLPILAPILELSVMDTKLKKVLERSLQDPVPAIRTNATVCLGLLATKFTKSKITQLCLPSFTRALRDNFPINRERALHSIKSTLDLYTTMELGTKILPHVSAVSGGGGDGGDGGSGVFSCCSRVVLLYLPDVHIFFPSSFLSLICFTSFCRPWSILCTTSDRLVLRVPLQSTRSFVWRAMSRRKSMQRRGRRYEFYIF